MRTTTLATSVVLAVMIAGCGSEKNSQTEEEATVADAPAEPPSDPAADMIEACHLKVTAPEVREWTTYWDPRGKRNLGDGPSFAHSWYWGNEEERKKMVDYKVPPLEIRCGGQDPNPEIRVGVTTPTLTEQDIPFGPGTYAIVARTAGPDKEPPKGVYAWPLSYGDSAMYEATSGTLTITRFDDKGIAGSFTIDASDLMTKAPFKVEGTFDFPCRGSVLESECKANKAILD